MSSAARSVGNAQSLALTRRLMVLRDMLPGIENLFTVALESAKKNGVSLEDLQMNPDPSQTMEEIRNMPQSKLAVLFEISLLVSQLESVLWNIHNPEDASISKLRSQIKELAHKIDEVLKADE